MIVFVVISLTALISYAALLALVLRHGLKGNRPRQLFFLYLLDMLLLQASYLMLSLADSKQEALLWYTFHVTLASAQAAICFFFTHAFLELEPPRPWVRSVIFAWLLATLSVFWYPDLIFTGIYRSEATGLLTPDLALLGVALLMPMPLLWSLTMFYLGRGYRNARSSLQRVRIQYVLLSILIVWVGLVANAWPSLRPYPIDVVSNIAGAFLIAYGILWYQLLDINIVIRKGLSYLISIVFISTGYFFTILVSTRFLHNLTMAQIFFLSLATAILAVILGRSVVDRVQLWIDQLFFREKYGSNLMIQRQSRTATSVLDLEKLTSMILDDLTQTLRIRWAAFFLEQENEFRLVAQSGADAVAGLDLDRRHPIIRWLSNHETAMTTDALDEMLAQDIFPQTQAQELKRVGIQMFIPLRARDMLIGVLGVSSKLAQQSYSQDDELTLTTLANQVSIAIDNARLYKAVQQELAERQQVEEALRESEQRYRLHFENITDVIYAYDTEFRIFDVSPSVVRALGYTPGELIGKSFPELSILAPECLATAFSDAMRVLAGEQITASEYQFVAKDGARKYGEVSGAPFVKGGEIIGVISVARDITERKRAEQELAKHRDHLEELVKERTTELTAAKERAVEAQRAAEAASRAKSAFLANMSHELRTPLNAILGYAQILQRRPLDADVLNSLDVVQKSGEHLLTLINDLLDIAKVEAGRMELGPIPIHFPTFLEYIASITRARAEARRLAFSFETPTSLPAQVRADETRLRQVLLNLLGNAVKFTDAGQVTLRVEQISDRQPKGAASQRESAETVRSCADSLTRLRFQVQDTGIGIPPNQLERIFQPFEQAENAARRTEGTGLGLTISRQLVQLMGGELHVQSQPGLGSTFWFEVTLPAIQAAAEMPTPPQRPITGYSGPRRTILVVDDVPSNRAVLADLLRPLGFDVVEAADGLQAIHLARELYPDLVLMDRWMPALDGFETARQMRQISGLREMPIIAVSASVSEHDREQSRQVGIDAFLPKPIHWPELAALLQNRLTLEWQYEPAPETPQESQTLLPPPQEELAILHDLAMQGNMRAILRRAAHIESLGGPYAPFAARLRQMANAFEVSPLLALVKHYLEEKC